MEQLSLDSRLAPPGRPTVAFDTATIDAVVPMMADAMIAVFHAGGGSADDEPDAAP
jgi:hypothetical protein